MAEDSVEAIRTEAKRRGIAWRRVLEALGEVKAAEVEKRAHANELRRHAWFLATADRPYAWEFWRVGFRTRFGRLVDGADYKAVPGYDVLHAEVCCRFPEFADDDGCERLWSFLMAPYVPLPPRVLLLRAALELADASRCERSSEEFVLT